jgi:hypothetical protein
MMKKLHTVLAVLALTMVVGSNRQALAGSCFSSTQCHDLCDEYCISKTSTCQSANLTSCNANGQQTCNVLCKNGSGYFPTCNCSSQGGGSPIFKKVPVGPPPEPKKDGKQASKTAQPVKDDSGQCPGNKQPSR